MFSFTSENPDRVCLVVFFLHKNYEAATFSKFQSASSSWQNYDWCLHGKHNFLPLYLMDCAWWISVICMPKWWLCVVISSVTRRAAEKLSKWRKRCNFTEWKQYFCRWWSVLFFWKPKDYHIELYFSSRCLTSVMFNLIYRR